MFALPLRSSNPDFLYGKYAASLFAAGEQGVWYDPSDMSTMFQDAAGTTPVTAMEQPVGLILDKSKGLVLGPELVTNGDFSNGTTGWGTMNGATIVVVNGELEVTGYSTECFARARQYISVIPGRTYLIRATARRGTAWPYPYLSPIAGTDYSTASRTNVTIGGYYVAQNNTIDLQVGLYGCGSGTVYFDNISVREVPGNHARQTTTASRPVLSARYNLLTNTERFGATSWLKFTTGSSTVLVTDNFGIAPDGTQTATRLQLTGSGGFAEVFQRSSAVVAGVQYRVSIWMRSLSGTQNTTITGASPYSSLVTVTEQWQQFSIAATATASNFGVDIIANALGASASLDILVWHPDLRVANESSSLPVYQRVNTATDYDITGFKPYLRFDGVDDWLVTPSINFTSTDKVTVFAGVRKLSDATRGIIVEQMTSGLSGGITAFALSGPQSNGASSYAAFSASAVALASVLAPSTNVLTGIFAPTVMIAQATLKVNGGNSMVADGNITASMVNQPITIGRRGTGVHPFNGRLYGLIVRGAQTDDLHLTNVERYLANKSGVTL